MGRNLNLTDLFEAVDLPIEIKSHQHDRGFIRLSLHFLDLLEHIKLSFAFIVETFSDVVVREELFLFAHFEFILTIINLVQISLKIDIILVWNFGGTKMLKNYTHHVNLNFQIFRTPP